MTTNGDRQPVWLEAAHIGDVPVSAISSAYFTWDRGREVRDFDVNRFDPAALEQIVAEWQDAVRPGSGD